MENKKKGSTKDSIAGIQNKVADVHLADKTIVDLFRTCADQWPENTAITYYEQQLSYAQLDALSDSLASLFIDNGVGPESVVLISTERSIELVVCLLAILKSGGCYLFVEPGTPVERLEYIIVESCPACIVTLEDYPVELPETAINTLFLQHNWLDSIAKIKRAEPVSISPDTLAYVSYTSGTTGRPKGVCVTHKNVIRLIKGWVSVTEHDRFLQVSSCAFDAATLEIWGTLCSNGACLVSYGPGQVMPDKLSDLIKSADVSVAWLTAGIFHIMIDNYPECFAGMRHVVAGGDVLSPPHVNKLLSMYPGLVVSNGYGPTENTTFTTTWTSGDSDIGESVPIGTPVAGTGIIILDQQLEPTKEHDSGELYTYGHGLSRQYLNQPAETAEHFLPNPFSGEVGDRMYKTGDIVRWNSQCQLEFLGRVDNQIKIRGYRVDPLEVEQMLLSFPRVKLAAVTVRQEASGRKKQVAFVELSDKSNSNEAIIEIEKQLKSKLPGFMIPASIIPVETFRLNINGKLDRKYLSALEYSPRGLSTECIKPENDMQRYLTGLWVDLLKKSPIGINDDFFDLGGDSLLAAELIERIRVDLGIKVPASKFYFDPNIVVLSTNIELLKEENKNENIPL